MATNKLPKTRDELFALAEALADALHTDEVRLGVKQNTETSLRAELKAAIEARNTYNLVVSTHADLKRALEAADSEARTFIVNSRNVLRNFIGKPWSPAWQATGFPNDSVAVPAMMTERLILLGALGNYFQVNPDKQNDALKVTGIHAGELFKSLQDARAAVSSNDSETGDAIRARRQSEQALRWRITGLIGELRQLMDDDDPGWYRFGLSRPADPVVPAVPDQVVVIGGLPGSVQVTWDPSRRAERYRIFKKEDGDDDFLPIATTADPFATIDGLEHGATLQILVRAANAAGESLPSDPAQIVVPAEPVTAVQA